MDNLNSDEMETKDIAVDENSLMLSEDEVTSTENPPIVFDPRDMFYYLDYHLDDIRFVMELVRKSTIEFTDYQKNLITAMEGEYASWIDAEEDRNMDTFVNYAVDLQEDLIERETVDPEFCEEQKMMYQYVYQVFVKSSFPYSEKQLNLLEELKVDVEQASGNLDNMHDLGMLEEFQEFLELMENKDHVNSRKFYLDCTVEYYVQDIIDELYYAEWDERSKVIPDYFAGEPMARFATFVKSKLKSAYHGVHSDSHSGLFHQGLSEIYYRLLDIFKVWGFLNDHQTELLCGTFVEIEKVTRNPNTRKYEDIHLGFYGFMDALRRDHKKRETKIESGYRSTDEEGTLAKLVKKMVRELIELEDVEKKHRESFPEYSYSIPELTNKLLYHFRRIYPENEGEPVTITLSNGYIHYPST